MTPLAMTATTLITALGRGEAATLTALREGRTGLTPCDFPQDADADANADVGADAGANIGAGAGYIGRVAGLDEWRLDAADRAFQCRNNALADMALRAAGFRDAVDAVIRRYGADRVATVIGTSTSGILSAEDAYRARDPATGALPGWFSYPHSYDLFSIAAFVRQVLGLHGPGLTVSTACASSARAFIDAHDLIAAGFADAALVGGTDSLCRLTLRGFASLGLISPRPCRPCDAARDGISIGEAAGFVVLERAQAGRGGVALLGFGASSDGYHISSPRPDGAGAAEAMRQALDRAGLSAGRIDYINLHGTGTRANDAMEDAAVAGIFGDAVPCSSTKGATGHTMGSCGVVEALIAKLSIEHGFVPGSCGLSEVDPSFGMQVAATGQDRRVRHVLSNAFGFGGINCSLLFGAV